MKKKKSPPNLKNPPTHHQAPTLPEATAEIEVKKNPLSNKANLSPNKNLRIIRRGITDNGKYKNQERDQPRKHTSKPNSAHYIRK